MTKIVKWIFILFFFVVFLVAGIFAFSKLFLTNERLHSLLIPSTELVLGRKIEVGNIKFGLISGLIFSDLVIKEKDNAKNFLTASSLSFKYEIFSLFDGNLAFREVKLNDPNITIIRDEEGVYNYASLAFLNPKQGADNGFLKKIPADLWFPHFIIDNARIHFTDAMGLIPAIESTASGDLSVTLAKGGNDLQFQGQLAVEANSFHFDLSPTVVGNVNVSNKRISYDVDVNVERHSAHFNGALDNYYGPEKLNVECNVSGHHLDISGFIAMMRTFNAKKSGAYALGEISMDDEPGLSFPLHGTLLFDKTSLADLESKQVGLKYTYSDEVLTVDDFQGQVMGGEVRGEFTVFVREILSYKGKLGLHNIETAKIKDIFMVNMPGDINGNLAGTLEFGGLGYGAEKFKKNFSGAGEVVATDVMISGTDIVVSMASLLRLPEMRSLAFKEVAGEFSVRRGAVSFSAVSTGPKVVVDSSGMIDFDSSINVPAALTLSEDLSARLLTQLAAAKFMERQNQKVVVQLNIGGTISDPVVELADQTLKKKVYEDKLKTDFDGRGRKVEAKPEGQETKGVLNDLFGK